MRKKAVIWLVLWAIKGYSQFSDSVYYRINYTSTGNYNRTNTFRSYLLNNTMNLNYRKKPLDIGWNTKWLYGKQQNALVNNDITSLLDFSLYKSFKNFYYWGLCFYNKSYSLRINNQMQTGIGVAYIVINNTHFKLNLSEGILYDYSDVSLQDTVRDVYGTLRNSFRLQARYHFQEIFNFSGTFYIQNSLQYRRDIIYKGDVDLAIRLKKWLSLTAKLTYNKFERTRRENLFVTYGFTIDQYF